MSYKKKIAETKEPQDYKGNRFSEYLAKNRTDSNEKLFESRKYYRDAAFEKEFLKNKNPINFWTGKMGAYYGKVNFDEEPVYINEHYLKQYKSDQTFFGLAPVVEAFTDMTEHIKQNQLNLGGLSGGAKSIFRRAKPKGGWESLNGNYSKYLQDLGMAFVRKYLTPAKEKRIRDFKTFLTVFTEFVTSGFLGEMPLTLTGYMRSRFCNPRVSGLVVEVFDAEYDNDVIKKGFLEDPGLDFWVETAEKFGFFVDKNAPWRLTANITYSTAMGRYMSKHGVPYGAHNRKKIFNRFYRRAYDIEIPVMQHYLAEIYNNYVNSRPTIAVASLKQYCVAGNPLLKNNYNRVTSVETVRRESMDCFVNRRLNPASTYSQEYGELFWIRYYYNLRMLEEKKAIDTAILNADFRKRLHPYYRVHGLVPTIRAINQELNRTPTHAPRVTRELKQAYYKRRK